MIKHRANRFTVIFSVIACLLWASAARAEPIVSHFPQHGLGHLLTTKFDLASIRSSLGPRRTAAQRTFADLGMNPSETSDDKLVFDSPGDWRYEFKIIRRGDLNKDGLEDLEVCFTDRALNGGTYNVSQGLIITRYSQDGYAVAISFSPGRAC